MARRDAASAAALVLVASFALVQSAGLDVGTVTRPGPGFFPLVLAAALLVVSAVLLLRACRIVPGPEPAGVVEAPAGAGGPARRPWALVAAVAALAVYVAVFETLGFVLATIGMLAFLFGAVARYRWLVALGAAVAIALAARVVFDTWLQLRLPPGLLGR